MKKASFWTGIALFTIAIASIVSLSGRAHIVRAQTDPCANGGSTTSTSQYCLLEPLPGVASDGTTPQPFDLYDPAQTDAAAYINIIIKVFISIIGLLGVVMIILGGVQYMTTDAVSKKEDGKEMISNSVAGIVLALASWLILNLINPHLTDIRIQPPNTVTVNVSGVDAPPSGATPTDYCAGIQVDGHNVVQGAAWPDDSTIRSQLVSAGVNVVPQNCTVADKTPGSGGVNCTSVYGYDTNTLGSIKALRNAVCGTTPGCTITLTGGTECWEHATHGPGHVAADFDETTPNMKNYVIGTAPNLNTNKVCIAGWPVQIPSSACTTSNGSTGAWQYTVGTTIFMDEGNHFHVSQW